MDVNIKTLYKADFWMRAGTLTAVTLKICCSETYPYILSKSLSVTQYYLKG